MSDIRLADVSEFQGAIDWAAYAAQNEAVIIRVHNGWRADYFAAQNIAGARANVKHRAWYQYLPASVDPAGAARALLATLGPLRTGECLVLDLEEGLGDQRARRAAWYAALAGVPNVKWTYSGLNFAAAHLPGVGIDWVAAYGQAEPTVSHHLWQYTNAQSFAGIAHPCDGSVFHDTAAVLGELWGDPVAGGSGTGVHVTPPPPPPVHVVPKPVWPAFPLPKGNWYGVNDGTPESHSGLNVHDQPAIMKVQAKVGAKPDGHFGPVTEGLVKRAQGKLRLVADGKVGPITWAALGRF